MNDSITRIELEFERAAQARSNGNEGQARVCARRAAGIAIRDHFKRRGVHPPSTSAYDLLIFIKEDPLLPPDLKRVADHLTLRVTEEFNLPVNTDLVSDARLLCEWLLNH